MDPRSAREAETMEKLMNAMAKKHRGELPERRTEPTEVSDDDIMTIRQVAEYLKCHPTTLYRLVKMGRVTGFRVGGLWRFQRSVIDKWMHDYEQMKPR
jgi:excisionase family DNA binding protein